MKALVSASVIAIERKRNILSGVVWAGATSGMHSRRFGVLREL
jgi:hypothetical protein